MKKKEQTIECSVHDCKFCDCECDECSLKCIKVCNCGCNFEKEDTMCASYKKKSV